MFIQVNWTGEIQVSDIENGKLPDVIVPSNVSDSKFCQVSFASEKKVEFSFSVRWGAIFSYLVAASFQLKCQFICIWR